jgi:hypothetical protein
MQSNVLNLELDQQAAGQVLESLAERLLKLERLRADEVDEDSFADAKNDALSLRPLYLLVRQQAIQKFGKAILEFSGAIAELDSLYSP